MQANMLLGLILTGQPADSKQGTTPIVSADEQPTAFAKLLQGATVLDEGPQISERLAQATPVRDCEEEELNDHAQLIGTFLQQMRTVAPAYPTVELKTEVAVSQEPVLASGEITLDELQVREEVNSLPQTGLANIRQEVTAPEQALPKEDAQKLTVDQTVLSKVNLQQMPVKARQRVEAIVRSAPELADDGSLPAEQIRWGSSQMPFPKGRVANQYPASRQHGLGMAGVQESEAEGKQTAPVIPLQVAYPGLREVGDSKAAIPVEEMHLYSWGLRKAGRQASVASSESDPAKFEARVEETRPTTVNVTEVPLPKAVKQEPAIPRPAMGENLLEEAKRGQMAEAEVVQHVATQNNRPNQLGPKQPGVPGLAASVAATSGPRNEGKQSSDDDTSLSRHVIRSASPIERVEDSAQPLGFSTALATSLQKQSPAQTSATTPEIVARQEEPLFEQLQRGVESGLRHMKNHRQDGGVTVKLKLYPEELGEVTVKLELIGKNITASFQAMQPAATEALKETLPQLREILTAQGFGEVMLGAETASSFSQGQQSKGQEGRYPSRHNRQLPIAQVSEAPNAVPELPGRQNSDRRLDYRL